MADTKILKSIFFRGTDVFMLSLVNGKPELVKQTFDAIECLAQNIHSASQPNLVLDKTNFETVGFEVCNGFVFINPHSGVSHSGFIRTFDYGDYTCFYFSEQDYLILHIQDKDAQANYMDEVDKKIFDTEQQSAEQMLESLRKLDEEITSVTSDFGSKIENFCTEVNKMAEAKTEDGYDPEYIASLAKNDEVMLATEKEIKGEEIQTTDLQY